MPSFESIALGGLIVGALVAFTAILCGVPFRIRLSFGKHRLVIELGERKD